MTNMRRFKKCARAKSGARLVAEVRHARSQRYISADLAVRRAPGLAPGLGCDGARVAPPLARVRPPFTATVLLAAPPAATRA